MTHVCIVVQNLPVPLDRRVWLECQALRDAGYQVSVICPKGPGDPAHHMVDGVSIHKYQPARQADGLLGYVWEFAYSWVRTAALSVAIHRRKPIDVLQACNPPDTYWALARLWKRRTGGRMRFVFDHHDLNPEVFLSRFGEPSTLGPRLQLAGLRWLERRTFRTADRVISTNESYRQVALQRGQVARWRTSVVRSGPDTDRMRPAPPDPELTRDDVPLLVYLGIMGPQDGVDVVLRVADKLINEMGRRVRVALLGFGDSYDELVAMSAGMGLDPYVEFTGRADPAMIERYLSSATVGLSPDPRSPLNDVSTMNKTMEYMAYGLPVVAFDLIETKVSGGDAVEYVGHTGDEDADVTAFAQAVAGLLVDPTRRDELGALARTRAVEVLDWRAQREVYVRTFDELTGRPVTTVEVTTIPSPTQPVESAQPAGVNESAG